MKSSLKKMKGTPLKEESVIVRAQRSMNLLKRPASNIVLIGQNIGQKHQLLHCTDTVRTKKWIKEPVTERNFYQTNQHVTGHCRE